MKINWKVRFKNKTWLITFLAAIITLIYQVLDLFNASPRIPQESLIDTVKMLVDVLLIVGVVIDPTTSGITDSKTAMGYQKPNEEKSVNE